MSNTYEVTFEKNKDWEPTCYRVSVETSNYACYRELKDLIETTVSQYELAESMLKNTNKT